MLDREEFGSLLEARVLAKAWRQQYDHERPHSSLGYQTPAAFARTCVTADALGLRHELTGAEGSQKSP